MSKFDFIGGSYESRSVRADAQRTVNLYPELVESGTGKNKLALYGRPGLQTFTTIQSPVRGLWAGDNRLFAVGGGTFYEIFSGGAATARGTVANNGGHVSMFPNGNQLLVVSGGQAYCDTGTQLVAVTFQGGGNVTASSGTFLDGYFIVSKPSDKKFFLSALYDGLTWDPLDFATKEGYPDNIAAILNDHRDLWIFGDQTTEVWRNEGDADFPFRPDPSGFIHQGCIAAGSPIILPGGPAWLGGDTRTGPIAWRARGYQPVRVSDHALETIWSSYSTVADCVSYAFTDKGHTFWVLNFLTAGATWVYDMTLSEQVGQPKWHQWAYGSGLSNFLGRCHAYVFGKHLVGDRASGKIYQLSTSFTTDDGTPIERIRRAPHLSEEDTNTVYHRFQLDLETGETADPSFTLRWSDNGGKSFNSGVARTAGSAGDYKKRLAWRRLGKGRDRVFEVQSNAAMQHAWIDAYLRATPGLS